MRRPWLIVLGALIAVSLLVVPVASRDVRIIASLLGGVFVVIGLAPGRLQEQDPRHRCYRGESTVRS